MRLSQGFIFGILIWSVAAKGQSVKPDPQARKFSLDAHYSRGFLIVHSPLIAAIARGPVQTIEISGRFQTSDENKWAATHRFPWIGVKYSVTDFSNPKQIGLVHSVAPQLGFPLVRNRWFSLHSVWNIGLGFVSRPFHPQENNKNAANSTVPNVLIESRLETLFRPQKHMAISAGITFSHWSVGAIKMPNLGMNVVSVYAGVQARFGETVLQNGPKPPKEKYPFSLWIQGGAAAKQISFKTGNVYRPCAEISLEISKAFTPKSVVPLGINFFYDGTIPFRTEMLTNTPGKPGQAFRAGIHTGYEFRVHRLSLLFHAGLYFIKTDPTDRFHFARIGAKYQVHKRVMVYANLKTHLFVADFVLAGVGYKITDFQFKKRKPL